MSYAPKLLYTHLIALIDDDKKRQNWWSFFHIISCICAPTVKPTTVIMHWMPRASLRTGIQRIIMMWHFGVDNIMPRPSKLHALKCACAWANSLERPTTKY